MMHQAISREGSPVPTQRPLHSKRIQRPTAGAFERALVASDHGQVSTEGDGGNQRIPNRQGWTATLGDFSPGFCRAFIEAQRSEYQSLHKYVHIVKTLLWMVCGSDQS